MVSMRLCYRLSIRHPPPNNGPVQLLPHVQAVRRMPPVRRPYQARLRAQHVRVVRERERVRAVAVREVPPRVQRRELGGQLVVDAPGRQPGRGDHVEVAAPGQGLCRRRAARQWREPLGPRQLARGEGLAVGCEDLGVEVCGGGRCQFPGDPESRQDHHGLEEVFPRPWFGLQRFEEATEAGVLMA